MSEDGEGTEGLTVALIGATGAVGEELCRVLEERAFPVRELRPFASTAEGRSVEHDARLFPVESPDPARIAGADLVFGGWRSAVEGAWDAIRERGTTLVDYSGALELDASVPLWLPGAPGAAGSTADVPHGAVSIPRGIAAGVGLALAPLVTAAALERVTIVTFESASGAGRRGVGELSEQTLHLLNAMSGEPTEAEVFPAPLAFDCLPHVGMLEASADTDEERRLIEVTRRLLGQPGLRVEVTRARVPVFGGSLACVHAEFAAPIPRENLRDLWAKQLGVEWMPDELPTPRTAVAADGVRIGRVRSSAAGESKGSVAFAVALDDLRRGAALAAVEAAEVLCATD